MSLKSVDAFIALNRFGLGGRVLPASGIEDDPRGWLRTQISAQHAIPKRLAGFEGSAAIIESIHKARVEGPAELQRVTGGHYRQSFNREIVARTRHMIESNWPFFERMVLFWSNHFTVSNSKRIVGPAIPAFEREAIRPHVLGRFSDMLKAVSSHAVMISYLDNMASIGDNSPAGKRRNRNRTSGSSINENLAREILELHTLGVDGGYTQHDVVELAKIISGWSHGGLRRSESAHLIHGGFEFRSAFHEPGDKTVLGKRYRESGVDEGYEVLADLAVHPSTAKHIATKLVRHFVDDEPPAAAIERIASVFLNTDGDLAEVAAALVDLDEPWQSPTAKVKTHYEFIVAVHRATGQADRNGRKMLTLLRELGQVPFTAPTPAGWPDVASGWIAPEALMRRVEWVRGFAATLPASVYPDQLLDSTIGPVASQRTAVWVSRAPSGDAGNALVLASPEFQRR